jgi:hypothetical protein
MYSHAKLRKLHAEFLSLNSYEDKLRFFDQHFTIIPIDFPIFQTNLRSFFSDENCYRLYEILNFERNSKPLVRDFFVDDEHYAFSIRPIQSQVLVYNKYISAKFQKTEAASDNISLKEANEMLADLEAKTRQNRGLGFKAQFMTLFLKGVHDAAAEEQSVMVYRKKKIIELYLYTMGLLYGRFMQQLKSAPLYDNLRDPVPFEAERKVLLLEELGCIDAIRRKYAFLSEPEMNKKIAETLSLITGDNWLKFAGFIGNVLHRNSGR